jgi:septal ring factor EnvC (AmiA/AmiB activator)
VCTLYKNIVFLAAWEFCKRRMNHNFDNICNFGVQDASMRAGEVLELRSDLHILAEAFQEKERESAIYEASLKATRSELEELQQNLILIAEKLETAERDRAVAEESVDRLQVLQEW